MTVLCGGGTSGPKAGVGPIVDVTATAVALFLSGFLAEATATVLAPIISAAFSVDVNAYCGTDPPADPGLLATDVVAALAFPPNAQTLTAQAKIRQWFGAHYWYSICHCTTTTTPAAPTPSNPGTTSVNPGLPQGNYTPCWNVTIPYFVGAYSGTGQFPVTDLTAQGLPSGPTELVNWAGAGIGVIPVTAVPINPNIINMVLTLTVNEAIVGSTTNVNGGTAAWDASGNQHSNNAGNSITASVAQGTPSPQTTKKSALADLTDPLWWSFYVQNTDSVSHTGTLAFSFTCPPGQNYSSACCPPDPLLQGELDSILQYVEAIYAGLPVKINSFAESTTHTGLSGSGSISLATTDVAVKLTLTTVSTGIGSVGETPTFYFDAGFISFTTVEGTYPTQRIEYQNQIFTIPLLGYTLNYSLGSGVIATVTELTPGP